MLRSITPPDSVLQDNNTMSKKSYIFPLLPLLKHPLLCGEVLLATFFIALLNLASPIFSMQVLNRYISHGFDGTLITLTIGVLIALIFLVILRVLRGKVINAILTRARQESELRFASACLELPLLDAQLMGRAGYQQRMLAFNEAQKIFSPAIVTSCFDAPFSLLYLGFVFLISPLLGMATAFLIVLLFLGGEFFNFLQLRLHHSFNRQQQNIRTLLLFLFNVLENIKSYPARNFLLQYFQKQFASVANFLLKISSYGETATSYQRAISLLLNVVIYGLGGIETVEGKLTIGGLIGASILSSRAFGGITSFLQVRKEIARARIAWNEIESFLEQKQVARKVQLKDVTGRLECRDLTFVYPEATNPVFERLSFVLEPGTSLAVVGANGTGKSTFLRLLAGLIAPGRGYVFVDGQNLAQMDNKWWQEQIIYLPQEPGFLPLSIRENILLGREVEDDDLQKAIELAGLTHFLIYSPQGLETILLDGGLNLPVGIRKRIALARAILKPGKIVIMDEPTASLDMQGRKAVYNLLNLFHKQGRTIILATDDPAILKGTGAFVDLNYKPVPKIKTNQRLLRSGVIQ